MLDPLQLTGRTRSHIVQLDEPRVALHRDAAEPFLAMRKAAASEGMDLRVASGFRDFYSQCAIWRRKFSGERPLLNAAAEPVERTGLSDDELIDLVLRWSALPGASRHHWGSELDLYDATALEPGHGVELLPAEYAAGGPFFGLLQWLEARAGEFGFYRPYREDLGGVLPEPWHWSFAPVSVPAQGALTPTLVAEALDGVELPGRQALQARLAALFASHVLAVAMPDPGTRLA